MAQTSTNKTPELIQTNKPLENNWWWLKLLLGMLAIFFGVTAVFWPGLTLVTLVYLFGVFILAWGVIEIINGLLHIDSRNNWWLTLLFGVIGLGIGIYLLRNPNVSFHTFIVLAGLALIARGVFELVGIFLDKQTDGVLPRTLSGVAGVTAVVAGIILLFQPESGGVAMVWIMGLFAIVLGVVSIVSALAMFDQSRMDDH